MAVAEDVRHESTARLQSIEHWLPHAAVAHRVTQRQQHTVAERTVRAARDEMEDCSSLGLCNQPMRRFAQQAKPHLTVETGRR